MKGSLPCQVVYVVFLICGRVIIHYFECFHSYLVKFSIACCTSRLWCCFKLRHEKWCLLLNWFLLMFTPTRLVVPCYCFYIPWTMTSCVIVKREVWYTNLEGKDFRSRYFLPKISIWSSILNSFIWGYWGNLLSGNSNYAPCVLNYLFGSKLRSNWSPANIIIICWRSKNLDSDWSLNTHVYLCLWLRACMLGIRNSAVSLNWNIASTEGYFGATSGDVLALAFLVFSYWLLCPFWVLMLWFISWNLHYWLWSVLVYYLTFAVKTNLKLR